LLKKTGTNPLYCSVGANFPLSLILPLQGGGNRWGYIPQQESVGVHLKLEKIGGK